MEKQLNDIAATLNSMNNTYVSVSELKIPDLTPDARDKLAESQHSLYEAWKKLRKLHEQLSSDYNSQMIRQNAAKHNRS